MFNKKIVVMGLGYIGLPTAAMFASKDQLVVGVDVNECIVNLINNGDTQIIEPGLAELVKHVVKKGGLRAASKPEAADVFLIAVPTPFKINGDNAHKPDLSHVKDAARQIAPFLKKGDLVILESTSPVGTTLEVAKLLAEMRSDLSFPHIEGDGADVFMAYCPERVLPGKIIAELCDNDRIIGGLSLQSSKKAKELYQTFVTGECILTNSATAEMVKLTENAARDVQIAFANEVSMICDRLEIKAADVISLANRHPRINILQPGPGVGGHCIAVDPWFIVDKAPNESTLIKTAREINDAKPLWVINKVNATVSKFLKENSERDIKDITIACYGLTYKPDIDDFRESPALFITLELIKSHIGKVIAVEPNINDSSDDLNEIDFRSFPQAQKTADIHVLLVGHRQFKKKVFHSEYLVDCVGHTEEKKQSENASDDITGGRT